MHYEVLDLRTNHVLLSTTDRAEAERAIHGFEATGRPWDDLDLVEVAEGGRRSLVIREHESAARKMMAESKGHAYRSFRTLAEAQAAPVAVVMVEGDSGGQVYATCPAKLVRCTEERLHRLAEELEAECWGTGWASGAQVVGTDDDSGAQVLYEPLPVGAGVAGGMGGGLVVEGVWVHEEIRQLGWASAVEGILLGTQDDLPPPRPRGS